MKKIIILGIVALMLISGIALVANAEDTKEVQITDVKGGLGVTATVVSGSQVPWSIKIDGLVLYGGYASGTTATQGITQIKLPMTIAIGKVDIRVTVGSTEKLFTAVMVGPIVVHVREK